MATRREFLRQLGGAVTMTASSLWLQRCAAGAATVRAELSNGMIRISKSEAPTLGQIGGVLLVRTRDLPMPIVLRRLQHDEIVALSTICSHAGCEVRVLPNRFECPCHGSEYDADGEVLEGPASQPLQRFTVDESEQAYIIRINS